MEYNKNKNMKHCWNETGKGKPKYWEKKLSQCHFVQKNRKGTGLDLDLDMTVRDERKLANSGGICTNVHERAGDCATEDRKRHTTQNINQ